MTQPDVERLHALRVADRRRCWELAKGLGGRRASIWAIEFLKAAQVRTERIPGLLSAAEGRRLGILEKAGKLIRFWIGALVATIVYIVYALVLTAILPRQVIPAGVRRGVAVHGEWSTRNRHVLEAVPQADPPIDFVIQIGRIRQMPVRTQQLWGSRVEGLQRFRPIVPISAISVWQGLKDWPRLCAEGARCALKAPLSIALKEIVAIGFRTLKGSVADRWWETGAAEGVSEVIFGITGTADATLLERAMHNAKVRTIHAVHGQATGPNFYGISDIALFRSGYDAKKYQVLNCYGSAQHQKAEFSPRPMPKAGIFVYTNLSHPMNLTFIERALNADIQVLESVEGVANNEKKLIGKKFWKPHPALSSLPRFCSEAIRKKANHLGFTEVINRDEEISALAEVYIVITTPSTIALDQLCRGIVAIVVDPLRSITDEAISQLPQALIIVDSNGGSKLEIPYPKLCPRYGQELFSKLQPAEMLSLRQLSL